MDSTQSYESVSDLIFCQGTIFDHKEFKRNLTGSGAYAPTNTVVYNTVVRLCHFFFVAGKLILNEYLTVTIVSQKYQELSLKRK